MSSFPKVTWAGFERSKLPRWLGDNTGREHNLAGGVLLDPAQFPAIDAVVTAVNNGAGYAAGVVAINVDALPGPIPANSLIRHSAGKYIETTNAKAIGATSLDIAALAFAVVDNDPLTYMGLGLKTVLSGIVVGRTFAERAANTPFGPAADADDEVRIILFDVPDVTADPQAEIARPGTLVKENFLPQWATLSAALKAKIRAIYDTTIGVP